MQENIEDFVKKFKKLAKNSTKKDSKIQKINLLICAIERPLKERFIDFYMKLNLIEAFQNNAHLSEYIDVKIGDEKELSSQELGKKSGIKNDEQKIDVSDEVGNHKINFGNHHYSLREQSNSKLHKPSIDVPNFGVIEINKTTHNNINEQQTMRKTEHSFPKKLNPMNYNSETLSPKLDQKSEFLKKLINVRGQGANNHDYCDIDDNVFSSFKDINQTIKEFDIKELKVHKLNETKHKAFAFNLTNSQFASSLKQITPNSKFLEQSDILYKQLYETGQTSRVSEKNDEYLYEHQQMTFKEEVMIQLCKKINLFQRHIDKNSGRKSSLKLLQFLIKLKKIKDLVLKLSTLNEQQYTQTLKAIAEISEMFQNKERDPENEESHYKYPRHNRTRPLRESISEKKEEDDEDDSRPTSRNKQNNNNIFVIDLVREQVQGEQTFQSIKSEKDEPNELVIVENRGTPKSDEDEQNQNSEIIRQNVISRRNSRSPLLNNKIKIQSPNRQESINEEASYNPENILINSKTRNQRVFFGGPPDKSAPEENVKTPRNQFQIKQNYDIEAPLYDFFKDQNQIKLNYQSRTQPYEVKDLSISQPFNKIRYKTKRSKSYFGPVDLQIDPNENQQSQEEVDVKEIQNDIRKTEVLFRRNTEKPNIQTREFNFPKNEPSRYRANEKANNMLETQKIIKKQSPINSININLITSVLNFNFFATRKIKRQKKSFLLNLKSVFLEKQKIVKARCFFQILTKKKFIFALNKAKYFQKRKHQILSEVFFSSQKSYSRLKKEIIWWLKCDKTKRYSKLSLFIRGHKNVRRQTSVDLGNYNSIASRKKLVDRQMIMGVLSQSLIKKCNEKNQFGDLNFFYQLEKDYNQKANNSFVILEKKKNALKETTNPTNRV